MAATTIIIPFCGNNFVKKCFHESLGINPLRIFSKVINWDFVFQPLTINN